MPPYDVLVFGDTCADLILSGGDVVPQFGQVEKLVDGYALELGGSCCIFAAQAARLGLRVNLLGRVGADALGGIVMHALNAAGVDTHEVVPDPALQTGVTVHLVADGDRAMLTHLGSLNALTPADVTDARLQSARHLHYGSLYLHTGLLPDWVNILQRAKTFGLTVSLDTNWDPADRWGDGLRDALPLIDVFMPNEQEAIRIAGAADLDTAIGWLRERVGGVLVVKRGERGADAWHGDRYAPADVAPAPPGGDGIGAGDSFDAGFLAGWLAGLPLDRALAIACACGRAVAGKIGGTRGQLTRADLSLLP